MSAEMQYEAASARARSSGPPPAPCTRRSTSCSSAGPPAPVLVADPTSSWSNRHTTWATSAAGAPASDSIAHHVEQRLSRRAEASSSPAPPRRAGGVRSWSMRSHARTERASKPPVAASHDTNSPSVALPRPQIGVRCTCLSRSSPRSPISRSRWMASCGTRATGVETFTSRTEPSTSTTRPDTPRSRSSHEFASAPP